MTNPWRFRAWFRPSKNDPWRPVTRGRNRDEAFARLTAEIEAKARDEGEVQVIEDPQRPDGPCEEPPPLAPRRQQRSRFHDEPPDEVIDDLPDFDDEPRARASANGTSETGPRARRRSRAESNGKAAGVDSLTALRRQAAGAETTLYLGRITERSLALFTALQAGHIADPAELNCHLKDVAEVLDGLAVG